MLIIIDEIPLSLLFFKLNNPNSQPLLVCQMLQFHSHLCDPSLDSLQYVHPLLLWRNPEHFSCLTSVLRGRITSLDLQAGALPNAAQGAAGILCHEGTLLIHVQLVHQDFPGPFL